jgi:hypothetical protein
MANIPWGAIGTVLQYMVLPLVWISRALLIVLRAFVSPFYHTLRYATNFLLLPVRFLARFEVGIVATSPALLIANARQTLYIYFGTAIVVGIVAGLIIHVTSRTFITLFGINQEPEPKPTGRTVASYRAEKAERQARIAKYSFAKIAIVGTTIGSKMVADYKDPLIHDRSPGGGLLSTTILEEDDSSEAGFL